MKNLFLLLMFNITVSLGCYAQQLVNEGLAPGLNNDPAITGCMGSFANGGAIPNWHKTMGTPHFVDYCHLGDGTKTISMGAGLTSTGVRTSEGIAANYQFTKGVKYSVTLHVCYAVNFLDAGQQFVVAATSVLPNNLQDTYPPIGDCATEIPTLNSSDIEIIRILDGINHPIITTLSHKVIHFSFTAQENRSYIWLFPEKLSGNKNAIPGVLLAGVQVFPECAGDKYFDDGTNGPITPIQHARYDKIYAGSSYGTNVPISVANDPDNYTSFIARDAIMIDHNFLATANGNNMFLANINQLTCLDIVPDEPSIVGGENKPGKDAIINRHSKDLHEEFYFTSESFASRTSSSMDKTISISPNPNSGSFTVALPQRGKYEIMVRDIIGAVVYETNLDNAQKANIQLSNSLPPGNYSVHINGSGIQHVEKITLIK